MKYIDADKIRDAIESEADNWKDTYTDCMRDNLLFFIDSLQQEQPEVDLKKEIKEWANLMVGASFPEQDGDFISEEDYRSVIRQTARHFYELGLNAKEEKK